MLEGLFITSLDFVSGMRLSKNEEFTHIFNNGLQFSWCIDPIDVESFTSHCGSVTNQNMICLFNESLEGYHFYGRKRLLNCRGGDE